jgi:hypothetical protein
MMALQPLPPLPRVLDHRGERITPGNLPAPNARWTPHRKQAVVLAVRGGLVTLDWARERYGLSAAEFEEWERLLAPADGSYLRTAAGEEAHARTPRPPSRLVAVGGRQVRLTGTEQLLLELLRARGGTPTSKWAIEQHLYGGSCGERSCKLAEVYILKLRRKITGVASIEQIWGRGWVLRERGRDAAAA